MARDAPTALCLKCLTKQPEAPFSQRLKALRLAANLTKFELAKKAGMTNGMISLYEKGKH
ncbi:MAG: helix-turn-helix transcriptional regulator, partial [Planctomycetes bacterium]|nr:helix-turn-helix transcriptional regulator [Planctomycetota bacterium]